MEAVIYCRVSTKEQVENLSLSTQQRECERYCKRNGWPVAAVFVEEGESAWTGNRTEFKRMRDFCRKNTKRVGVVVVYDLSRFARNTLDHLTIRALLGTYGIIVRSTREKLDESPTGKLTETLQAAIAQFRSDENSERTRTGMKAALELGRWQWAPPFGYARGERGGPSMKLHPENAPAVRAAFEDFGSGAEKADVLGRLRLHRLIGRGAPTTFKALDRMFRNPAYAGRIEKPEWGVSRGGDFEPLVSEITFDLVQARLSGRVGEKRRYAKDHPDFPLRRFIRCARCDETRWQAERLNGLLSGSAGSVSPAAGPGLSGYYTKQGRYAYYECPRCRARVPKKDLEQSFVWFLQSLQLRPEVLRNLRGIVLEAWKQRETTAREQRARHERALEDMRARLDRIADLLTDGTLDAETYQRQRARLREQIATAEADLAGAMHDHLDADAALAFGESLLGDAARLWEHATPEQKRRLQAAYFPDGLAWSRVRERDHLGEYEETGFRTRITPSMFEGIRGLLWPEGRVASPTGFEPHAADPSVLPARVGDPDRA